jgi:hypothetical protein
MPRTLSELHRATANIRTILEERITKTDKTHERKLHFKKTELQRHLKQSQPEKNQTDTVTEY